VPDHPGTVEILGLRVDALTIADATARIVDLAAQPDSPPKCVVQPYVEFFEGPDAVRKILNSAWLSLPNGVALQWAASYQAGRPSLRRLCASLIGIVINPTGLTAPLPERFHGASFTMPLLAACRDRGIRVFLVGSPKRQSIAATASHLRTRLPGIQICGTAAGRGPGIAPESLAAAIGAARADLVLVGLGFPRQELLISRLAAQLTHGVLIGEGGTFDYREFGGYLTRAPRTVRRLGLEWLWRLAREPTRLRRQAAIPRFIWRVHREAKLKSLD
jgi:N-acetylglucosaminyldiphosphoundecaprenol N-acetyl-beta-D-mannosaminyltransferase